MMRKATFSQLERSITCTNPIFIAWVRYWNCCDGTSVYSLNSWKLPGRFYYSLGMRL